MTSYLDASPVRAMSAYQHSVETVVHETELDSKRMCARPENRQRGRVKAVLPVRVSGMDALGTMFQELAYTLDIAPCSARLGGIHYELKPLERLLVQYHQRKIEFQVVWVKRVKQTGEYHVGLRNIAQPLNRWGIHGLDSTPPL